MAASLSPRPLHHQNNNSGTRRLSLTGDKALTVDASYNYSLASSPSPTSSRTLTPPSCINTIPLPPSPTTDMNSGASVSAIAMRRAQRNIQAGLSQAASFPDIIETSTERRGSSGSTSLALVSPRGYHYIRHSAHESSDGFPAVQISPRAVIASVPYRSRAKSLTRKPAPPLPDVLEQPRLEEPIRRNAIEAPPPVQQVAYEFLLHPPPTTTAHTQIIRRSKSRPNLQNLTCGILGSRGSALANFDDLEYQFKHIQQLQQNSRRSTSTSRTSDDLQISVEVVKEEFGLSRADSKANKRRSWKAVVNRARSGSLGSRIASSFTQPLSPSAVGVAY